MQRTSGRWRLGFALAALAAVMWSVLPIALKMLLDAIDAFTITWYRFMVAAVLLGVIQFLRGKLPDLRSFGRMQWLLLAVAVLGLMGNYVLYVIGLDYITPSAAQVVIQLAPMLLLLGALVLFGERFNRAQWLGLATLVAGLLLFFNHRLRELFVDLDAYAYGVLMIVVASVTWASYALAQKQLLRFMASEEILLIIYVAAVVGFMPSAELATVVRLDGRGWALLAFACLNTLLAYGAFAESLNHWDASRISAVLAVTPLLTMGLMMLLPLVSDAIEPEPLNGLSVFGAAMVVAGSMVTALSGRPEAAPAAAEASLE